VSVYLKFFGVVRVGHSHISHDDGIYFIECFLMYLITMPRDLLGLQGFGDFGMTTLCYQ
jgi:hypothetical protein